MASWLSLFWFNNITSHDLRTLAFYVVLLGIAYAWWQRKHFWRWMTPESCYRIMTNGVVFRVEYMNLWPFWEKSGSTWDTVDDAEKVRKQWIRQRQDEIEDRLEKQGHWVCVDADGLVDTLNNHFHRRRYALIVNWLRRKFRSS